MNIVHGLRCWSALIVAGALVMTAPLTLAEAAHGGGGSGGGRGGFGGGGGRGGFVHGGGFGHGGFAHGFHDHSFHGGFRGSVVIGLGGWWWDPWWYGPYWPYGPYGWGAPGYGYGYPVYPYEGYDPGYAYPPAAPPVGYEYGGETFQAPPPVTPPSQAPPTMSSQVPPTSAPVTASLQIEVTPVEAEILVDGMSVGAVKEIKGSVTVPVAAGAHTVAFRVGGVTTIENIVVSPQTTVLIKRDLGTAGAPQP